MRKSSTLKALAVAAALVASPVNASEYADRIILWLEEQGFTHFEVERTWLGRIKIEAYANGIEREIILNARTGEILRDYWEIEDEDLATGNFNPLAVPEGMGNSRHIEPVAVIDDDDHDDDHDDDDHDDDRDDDDDDADDDDHVRVDSDDSEDSSDDEDGDEEDEEDEEDDEDDEEDDD